jgi:hypothetical protein
MLQPANSVTIRVTEMFTPNLYFTPPGNYRFYASFFLIPFYL